MGSGEWLEKALLDICRKIETGLDLDADLISGLVSFCELAPPPDAADYLTNIIGLEAGQDIIQEYLHKRGFMDSYNNTTAVQTSNFQAYMKPPADEAVIIPTKKQTRPPKEAATPITLSTKNQIEKAEPKNISRGNSSIPKKKKTGKAISLAEAAKGSVVFQQGKPCSCQARRHKLVSNCLSCGKIVCEQEGEGPCSFCGALVLREGSTYAGLDDLGVPHSDAEAAAEAYAKRLVEYDRNSAARTKVIDDQSDYYEIEANSWLSAEEKEMLLKKQNDIQEADEARRRQVIVTFDLLGRKVVVNKDEASEVETEYSILRASEEREQNRIKPNPTVRVQPSFIDTGPRAKGKQMKLPANEGFCFQNSGRVQHDPISLKADAPTQATTSVMYGDDVHECSLDYN